MAFLLAAKSCTMDVFDLVQRKYFHYIFVNDIYRIKRDEVVIGNWDPQRAYIFVDRQIDIMDS